MGRKIPAKKHRGVKDPLIQQAKRLQQLKGKINAPPKDPDDQPVPKSLIQLFDFENRTKEESINLKRKKKKYTKGGVRNSESHSEHPVANLRKLPGETGRGFTMRINSAVRAIHTALDQEDYPLDTETEDRKGEQMALQRARRRNKRKKASAGAGASEQPLTKLSRAHKLALKKKTKMEKALERGDGGDAARERVAFGEVAHAPPALPVRPRRAAASALHRPGRKELLLSAMLGGGGAAPTADAQRRERARLAAVAAYRALRARASPPTRTIVHY